MKNNVIKDIIIIINLAFQFICLVGIVMLVLCIDALDFICPLSARYFCYAIVPICTFVFMKNFIYMNKNKTTRIKIANTRFSKYFNAIFLALPALAFAELFITMVFYNCRVFIGAFYMLAYVLFVSLISSIVMVLCVLNVYANKDAEKLLLCITYKDGKKYERCFDKLEDIPPFLKDNFLKYGIASIVFADDMSEVDNTDFEELFKNILEENDSETMALFGEHIEVWNSLTDTEESVEKFAHKFNEFYSKELTGEPKLKLNIKEVICNE